MAGIAHCTRKAGSHERAGCVRRTGRIKRDGHAVALGGEGREGAQCANARKAHFEDGPEIQYAKFALIPQAARDPMAKWSFGKFYLENSEQSQLGAGCCCNKQ